MVLPLALPILFLAFVVLLAVVVLMIELRILSYAFQKIGIPRRWMFAALLATLIGSHFNIPLYTVNRTVVAINVGGALVPVLLSLYLFFSTGLYARMLLGVAVIAVVTHAWATIVPGVGIALPMLVPPLFAAGVGLALSWRRAPPVAYVAGSMGTLIGADLTNLGRIVELRAPVVSIGGAGTFDGVFLTGIIAGLIA